MKVNKNAIWRSLLQVACLLMFGLVAQKASAWGCDNTFTGEINLVDATINVVTPITPSLREGYNQVVDLSFLRCASLNYVEYKDKIYFSTIRINPSFTGLSVVAILNGTQYVTPFGQTYYGEGYGVYPEGPGASTKTKVTYPINARLGVIPKTGSSGNISIKKNDVIAVLNMYIHATCVGCAQNFTLNIIAANDATLPTKGCNVTGSGTQTVQLDNIGTPMLSSIGKSDIGSKTFNLVFDCPTNVPVSVIPSGSALVAAQGVYQNLSTGTSAAHNIGVAMECDTGTGSGVYSPLVPGVQLSLGSTAIDGLTTRTCKASYYSQGNVTGGDIFATTTLNFSYN